MKQAYVFPGFLLLTLGCGAASPEPGVPDQEEQRAARSEPQDEPAEESWGTPTAMPAVVAQSSFLSTSTAVTAGKTFHLAFLLEVPAGYRLGWKSPGDVGAPTQVSFSAPPGFSVGEVQFPVPNRYPLEGGLVAVGYEDSLAVFAEVQAPSSLDTSGVYRFDVQASWLACKRECAREETHAFFELVSSSEPQGEEMPSRLRRHFERLPQPLSAAPGVKTHWSSVGRSPTLRITATEAQFGEAFVAPDAEYKVVDTQASNNAVSFEFEKPRRPPHAVRGILTAQLGDQEQHYEFEVPWPNNGL